MKKKKTAVLSSREILDLRSRLSELEATLSAIRTGEVDALIVKGPHGDQVYSLKGAEHPYRAFIERMGEGAVTLSPDGTILYCNQRFADMLGMRLERVISTNIHRYFAPSDQSSIGAMLGQDDGGTANASLLPKKGRPIPVRIAMSLLQDVSGSAHCAVISDLTAQQESKNLAEALSRLQQNQAELQKQYQEVQAIRAKLEQANAAKDEFLAALSHELRTPLTPVLLTANAMAVDPDLSPGLRSDVESIRRNVELEARLIDDLLDITRISRGKLKIVPKVTDIHEVIGMAVGICEADTAAKQLRFIRDFKAARHYVNADDVRLQQIFWNLLRNAVKFTPESGKITVMTRNVPRKPAIGRNGSASDTPDIVISVQDRGIGIARSDFKRIFEAFEQGTGEITRRFGGLGLGLTITKRLVAMHGGSVEVASPGAGKGSTFTVTLPTVPSPGPSAVRPLPKMPASARPLRILLVEDHEDTRKNMTRLLMALNHSVVPAHDAASALQQAARQPFDLVISDIGLPDESGFDLMKKLRARHKLRGICLSGYGMEDDIVRSREAGFSEHLIKPINFERLASALTKAAR